MMQYTVYKTVNLINGKFYIGVHKTDNPNDEYLGSGKLIKRAVVKYGEQNFRKEVLAVFENSADAFELEKRLVAETLSDSLCYNLKSGGEGGFDWINERGLADHAKAARATHKAHALGFFRRISLLRAAQIKEHGISLATKEKLAAATRKTWTGRKHSEITKQKMAKAGRKRVGSKNPQFGTCWITKDGVSEKIPLVEIQPFLELGWRRGRK